MSHKSLRQIAIYGKGGIGKSVIASHLTFGLASLGQNVMHVGCDPKHDSTRLLLEGRMPTTILDTLRKRNFALAGMRIKDVVVESPLSSSCPGQIYCAESGGPEAGVGCGGKGVTEAIATLVHLNTWKALSLDVVLYDVLGDVVCGGFAMPIRDGYAKEIYVVTSGEIEVLFATVNIFKAIARFSAKSGAKLGGLIGNLRNIPGERELLEEFSALLGTRIIGYLPYSETIKACSGKGTLVFEHEPHCPESEAFKALCETLYTNRDLVVPRSMTFDELHQFWVTHKQPS